jgi:hypothetical protein
LEISLEFNFTIDNTKDCLLETEASLRDLIDSVLGRKYGSRWEDDPNIGWNRKKKEELENRREKRKIDFPHQSLSNRLLDYTYLHDLKELISKNKVTFKVIFSLWEETMAMFDILGKFRNNLLHHENGILRHQHYLCLGICGQFLLAINNWKKGYAHTVESFCCDFRFEHLEERDAEAAKAQSLHDAEIWIKAIRSKSLKQVEVEQDISFGHLYKVHLAEGEVKISYPTISRQSYRVGYTQSANVHLVSKSIGTINRVLVEDHPCWTFNWTLCGELDIASLISIIEETHDKKPISTSSDGAKATSASYYIAIHSGYRIRVDISSGVSKTTNITLVYDDGEPNLGFINAHNIFSPDIILSILYGEIPKKDITELILKACK